MFFFVRTTKKAAHKVNVETLEIDVAPIHHVEGAGLRQNLIEDVDVMHRAVGDADKGGDVAMQIEQRVHFDGGFVLAESGPREQRKAQIDRGRVQGVQALVEVHADRILGVQRPRDTDQHLGEIGINAPVVSLVGVGECGARHLPAESNVIQFAAHRAKARLDVTQAFAVSQLGEGHRQILIPAREPSPVRVTAISGDTLLKLVGGQMPHELSKNSLADIHPSLSAIATPAFAAEVLGSVRPGNSQIEKSTISPNQLIPSALLAEKNI
jgi:hypothetical protein